MGLTLNAERQPIDRLQDVARRCFNPADSIHGFSSAVKRRCSLSISPRAAGRWACARELVVHHQPSKHGYVHDRSHLLLRNALYVARLRLPLSGALREALVGILIRSARARCLGKVAHALVKALPRLLQGRRVIPPEVERTRRLVEARLTRSDAAAEAHGTSLVRAATAPRDSRGQSD